MLMNGIISAINGHDTLRPLGNWFRPFANSARDTEYHRWCIVIQIKSLVSKHLFILKWDDRH
jgi:hypothetical protein